MPFLQRYSPSQLTTLTATVAFTTIITRRGYSPCLFTSTPVKSIDGHQGHEIMLEMEAAPLAIHFLCVQGVLMFTLQSEDNYFAVLLTSFLYTHTVEYIDTNTHRPLCIQLLTFIYLSKCIRKKRWNQFGGPLLPR